MKVSGKIVDVVAGKIFEGTLEIEEGKIKSITEEPAQETAYILPGFIDAHVHIESSMLIPSEFARISVVHGTVATVSDPHEIANVLGLDGVKFMISNGQKVPFKFCFGAPSCVPATGFETSGARFGPEETESLLKLGEIGYLSEMMNFPGVLFKDPEVLAKLELAKKYGKVVDGHAPGVIGEDAITYASAGISTDHECFTLEEARDKIKAGMKILIREGSAAKNFDALIPLILEYPSEIMFCSDDKHPDDLIEGHINLLVQRAVSKGYDLFDVLRCCTLNPISHYNLNVGLLRVGDPADFIRVEDLEKFNVLETYIDGIQVASSGVSLMASVEEEPVNIFNADFLKPEDLLVPAREGNIRVIQAIEGQLITKSIELKPNIENGCIVSDIKRDMLKILVMNRYQKSPPVIGFIHGFGLQKGAIASTVAHDSHNIIAIGTNDQDLLATVNLIIGCQGGISIADGIKSQVLALPVAGIMSTQDGKSVAETYKVLDSLCKSLGTKLKSPFMTLSFMALLVIPELKISDIGLFDGNKFAFTSLYVN